MQASFDGVGNKVLESLFHEYVKYFSQLSLPAKCEASCGAAKGMSSSPPHRSRSLL